MKEIEVYDVAVIEKVLSKKNRCRYSHYSQIYMTSISEITKRNVFLIAPEHAKYLNC